MGRERPDLTPVFWETGQWDDLELSPITLTSTNTYTRSTPTAGGLGIQRGRLTHSAGAEGNDRRMYLLPDYDRDTAMRVVWQAKSTVAQGNAQIGHVHRVRVDPDGFTRAWMVRHDFAFNLAYLLAAEVWRWPTGAPDSLTIAASSAGILSGLQKSIAATGASRTANVVTATGLPSGHGITTGQTVSANFADDTYDGVFVITGSAATSVTWAQVAADDASAGAGTLDNLDGVLPMTVESELIGSQLAVRAWRSDQSVPSWTDETRALILRDTAGADPYPARRGRAGVYVGHLDQNFVEWGALERRRIR